MDEKGKEYIFEMEIGFLNNLEQEVYSISLINRCPQCGYRMDDFSHCDCCGYGNFKKLDFGIVL